MSEALLSCRGLVVGWRGDALLPPIDMDILPGHFVAVVGRNGSGKTTWFKTLLGQVAPLSGEIVRSKALDHIAYIPQSNAFDEILPLSARDVVLQGRLHCNNFMRPFFSRADRHASARALEEAGAGAYGDRSFRELSKGQRQRVMFARMLATEAELALLDEPTAAMDVVAEQEAMQQLAKLAREHGIAVVIISHALSIAERYADDLLLFDRRAQQVHFGTRDQVLASEAYRRLLEGDG
jgi:zinc transport system ATP-binding protein